nr:MAG TPA: hypothetical protein [Caudoviricetes sp.]
MFLTVLPNLHLVIILFGLFDYDYIISQNLVFVNRF